jgi:hypothetical protein
MLSLKSRKISLGVLAALVSIDWYAGMQAQDNNAFGLVNSSGSRSVSQSLPTLRIVQMPPMLMSGKLFNFTAAENAPTFQELQTLAFTVPLQLARLSRPEPAQETSTHPMIVETQTQLSNDDAGTKDPVTDSAQAPPVTRAKPKADTPQAANLIKLLALYSMLHR